MNEGLLLQGLVIGLGIAVPVGPVGLLVIQRTLAGGFRPGFLSGLGAAGADAVYGAIGGFGIGWATALLLDWQFAFRLAGGLFLAWLAWGAFRSRPAEAAAQPSRGGAFLSTFLLTMANPLTILSFAAIFGGVLPPGGAGPEAGWLVAGVAAGSTLWWLLLAGGTAAARKRLAPGAMIWLNRASGIILAAFAVYALAGLVL